MMSRDDFPTIDMVSNQACLLTFSRDINEATSNFIAQAKQRLECMDGIIDLVPSYTTLLVIFDEEQFDRFSITKNLRQILNTIDPNDYSSKEHREVLIPVYYGSEVGPDIHDVAQHCQMSVEDVIQRHSEASYRAYALGFTPGFAFLGNTPAELHIPRKTTPRLKVPTGSVAIAENQTAVYPNATPGGWQIIGRTPVNLIDWNSDNLALISIGDTVRFQAISREEFLAQGGQLDGF